MPDSNGRIPPVALGVKGRKSWDRIFGEITNPPPFVLDGSCGRHGCRTCANFRDDDQKPLPRVRARPVD